MERKRSQYQRFKQQRFCVSQQDITKALTCMKPTVNHFQERQLENLKNSSSTSAIEKLDNRSVSKLVKEFEARASLSPYASAQNLLPIVNDVISNEAEFNRSHMFIRTLKFKVDNSDNGIIINNNVCSSISPSTNTNGNQMVRVEIQPEQYTGDKEQEKNDEQIYETLDIDHCKLDLPPPPVSFYTTIDNNNNPIEMATRSTNIDEAALALGKRHEISFDELLTKEAQLNHALADLISISNDTDKSFSMNSSPRSTINKNDPRRTSSVKNDISDMSATVDLLNSLLEAFEIDKKDSDRKIANNIQNKSQRRRKIDDNPLKPINMFCLMLSDNDCANCHQAFATNEQIVNAAGHIWHTKCFVCTQCFQPFENGLYFEHEDRKYCERDFQMLFAPCCAECKQAIVGRIIRALQKCFHPDCFRCQLCQAPLIETGFSKYNEKALCRDCHVKEKAKDAHLSKQSCATCHQMIDNKYVKFKGDFHHSYHFQCASCQAELDENSREVRGSLYCLPCHNKLDIPVCAACRRLIDNRVISALGKQWHVEHFCCARCAQPFYGSKHFENKGLAYCESDYHFLFGSTCFICNCVITEGAYTACNKKYCADHFACSICEKKMNEKSKFFDVDAAPVCKPCYGKLPSNTRKSIQQSKKKQLSSILKQTSV
ncbi:unnamed protein product [Rotaria socialis]|uniref:LIM zinc-binding domain-containing protein n=1 Tax=Rotaria socialis TaxID=392032 RepID=A0A817P6Q2_9BILA|nr:unnamed protein product [Rotaria socialis]CAF3241569.1 unnamed protein product [Rotaria socialis]CAF4120685.1 unnamed protein product [Rotaria socialis]CAF4203031.1 unnamed protein product [Rotaria socialis]